MPLFLWIATFLGSIFSAIVGWFAQYLTKRLALAAAVISVIATLTVAFFAAILLLINAITPLAPPYVATAASMVIPSNLPICLSSIATAHSIRWVYEWNVKVIQLRLF